MNENIEYKKSENENRDELSIKTNEKIPPEFYLGRHKRRVYMKTAWQNSRIIQVIISQKAILCR